MSVLALVGKVPNHAVRVGALRFWGANIHPDATVYHGFEVRRAQRLQIGARSSIGNGAILDARGGLTIGTDVNLSTAVHIWTAQHAWDSTDFAYTAAPVTIGDRAWISTRVTILPGCTIGEGAVVAAGAVVAGDVAAFSLVGGVPAKVLAQRPRDLSYKLPRRHAKTWWW
ncbi:MAG: acyltransferase [Microbacteriaceae bacterium]|nr:acyltransferase [Microbacteriaceae bacterium]